MSTKQQTVLRVQTNIPSGIEITGNTIISVSQKTNITTFVGSGTTVSPFTGTTTGATWSVTLNVIGGNGVFNYNINQNTYSGSDINVYQKYNTKFIVTNSSRNNKSMNGFTEYNVSDLLGSFNVLNGDVIQITSGTEIPTGATLNFNIQPDFETIYTQVNTYDFLDLYGDIPIKINKSFAELQDISKRNSDFSTGLLLPGSKRNNKFFENYYNVDVNTLYFDITKRIMIDVLLNDEIYFQGYMKLNKVSVLNSKVEYDVTLYSTVSDLYGKIGNNLLKDLDYNDIDWHFNHYFNVYNVTSTWKYNTFLNTKIVPSLWIYPVIHNGYEYTGDTVNLSGGTVSTQSRLFTPTLVNSFNTYSVFLAFNGEDWRINSPKNPILDNQLKPGLNIYSLLHLMFKTYGYTIKSDFLETPWFKLLYMYGFYSFDGNKFGYRTPTPQILPIDGVDIILVESYVDTTQTACSTLYVKTDRTYSVYVVKKGTGIPCLCSDQISVALDFLFFPCNGGPSVPSTEFVTIQPNTTGSTYSWISNRFVDCGFGCPYSLELKQNIGFNRTQSNVDISPSTLSYLPLPPNTKKLFIDTDYVDFSLVIDTDFKQIDLLSSIAKKFNLVIIPNPEKLSEVIIEPYDYYIGSGKINDWTDRLSKDNGFSVEPALNYIESEIILTDQEDGDDANKSFKDQNKLIYGENRVYNQTDFKSNTKKIETIFSPEIIRKWDENNRIGIPLGINYTSQSNTQSSNNSEKVIWKYNGIKSKPRLIYNNGNLSPFTNLTGITYNLSGGTNTMFFRVQQSDGNNPFGNIYALSSPVTPVISHTLSIGNKDTNKKNNDSLCILFNSQEPQDIGIGISTFNTYTENDAYKIFYLKRIENLFSKNTRFLKGKFNLNLSDIKNFEPKDLIKIQEQFFLLNKIENYNLTNPELTQVELIQVNNKIRPETYPVRYFKYIYCNETNSKVYKFRTYFNPAENTFGTLYTGDTENIYSLRRTYQFWSLLYDYFVGILGGNVSGYTSSYNNLSNGNVWTYTINEITKSEYENSSYNFWFEDNNNQYFIDRKETNINNNDTQLIWAKSNQVGTDKMFLNVAPNCSIFSGYCSSGNITISPAPSSTPTSPYTTGITLNVTEVGWIRYNTPTGRTYRQITDLGTYIITDCADCNSIEPGFPFSNLANWVIINCGNSC
jgi:hypothetical protein